MMNKIFILFSFISLSLGSITAQTFVGNINPYPMERTTATTQVDTVKILAVLVEFQEDKDDATFGNGKFGSIYSKDYGLDILDPLPHNASYFKDHLEFAKNYFEKVSDSNLIVEYVVLENILTVSKTMRNYSPPANSNELNTLGTLADEVWTLAAQTYPATDFGSYDLFTIFHAGVGRDIRVPGSLGLERDLPSVYLSFKALKKILGDQFTGFDANGAKVTNSLILPTTESREVGVIGGSVLLELTINGLIAASIGSHLGLPDLFDTETGLSAIGRFGLMDGQSIFAFSGVFPPEPSPWEKIFLGWKTPVTAQILNQHVSISTAVNSLPTDTTILKVPINSTEYYLVENRARDAKKDGSIVTYRIGGKTFTKTFTKDTTGYRSFETDSLAGVITDVDEFDWAVPGNGIVIWHIDENVIAQNIADNKINNDKFLRGVDVEEADGIQDIGEEFQSIFGDIIVGEGTEDDFWFASNESTLYKNVFSRSTLPSTKSNSAANSLISFSDFSDISNKMSFNLSFGESGVNLLLNAKLNQLPGDYTSFNFARVGANAYYYFTFAVSGEIYKYDQNGVPVNNFEFSNVKPAMVEKADGALFFGVMDSSLTMFGDNGNGTSAVTKFNAGSKITTVPVIESTSQSQVNILVGTEKGEVIKITVSDDYNFSVVGSSVYFQNPDNQPVTRIITDGTQAAAVSGNKVIKNNGTIFQFNDNVKSAAFAKNTGTSKLVCLTAGNNFYVYQSGQKLSEFSVAGPAISSFSLADILANGENYIIVNVGNKFEAYNFVGAKAEGFPYTDDMNYQFKGVPLSADITGDSKADIVSATEDGRIFAFDPSKEKLLSVFPISAGTETLISPYLFNDNGKTKLAYLTKGNELFVWSLRDQNSTLFWYDQFGNILNSASAESASSSEEEAAFFPESKAYNWPNPVYDNETFIRYYVSENSQVEIKIFDLAGDLVAELNDSAAGGLDNETTWNVSDIQSGVYLAHLKVSGSSGQSAHKIIKIAVIK